MAEGSERSTTEDQEARRNIRTRTDRQEGTVPDAFSIRDVTDSESELTESGSFSEIRRILKIQSRRI